MLAKERQGLSKQLVLTNSWMGAQEEEKSVAQEHNQITCTSNSCTFYNAFSFASARLRSSLFLRPTDQTSSIMTGNSNRLTPPCGGWVFGGASKPPMDQACCIENAGFQKQIRLRWRSVRFLYVFDLKNVLGTVSRFMSLEAKRLLWRWGAFKSFGVQDAFCMFST